MIFQRTMENNVQFRFRKLARSLNGLYVDPTGISGSLSMSMRQRGEDGTELRIVRYSDLDQNQLVSVHWVLINDRYNYLKAFLFFIIPYLERMESVMVKTFRNMETFLKP